jgi:uncharacterized protein GlcG (DUF336 family)
MTGRAARGSANAIVAVFLCLFTAGTGCTGKGGTGEGTGVPFTDEALTAAEVETILAHAVTQARALDIPAVIAVSDRDGNVLGAFRMFDRDGRTYAAGGDPDRPCDPATALCPSDPDAPKCASIPFDPSCLCAPGDPNDPCLEGRVSMGLPPVANPCVLRTADAISKSGTAAYFQSHQNAFTTRTAVFIVQDHFPPGIDGTPGGPLYGVQFSSLSCTDINPIGKDRCGNPAGGSISGFLGGVPLFRDGHPVGGVGVVGFTEDMDLLECIALAGSAGFEAPREIRADRILLDGIRFPYTECRPAPVHASDVVTPADLTFHGIVDCRFPIIDSPGHPAFPRMTLGGVTGEVYCDLAGRLGDVQNPATCAFRDSIDPDPAVDPDALTVEDLLHIVAGAARRAERTRAAIRRPIGTAAQVFITVVDRGGNLLAIFRTPDATMFSLDVAVQKARTCAFFSDDRHGFTSRAIGFLSQGLYPPGIDGPTAGPLFFLQTCLGVNCARCFCFGPGTSTTSGCQARVLPCEAGQFTLLEPLCGLAGCRLANGFTIFPGGVPLYRNGRLVGAVGISGDGVDQDDIIADSGADAEGFRGGFQAPREVRCDFLPESVNVAALVAAIDRMIAADPSPDPLNAALQAFLGQARAARENLLREGLDDLRLPWVKFPRQPDR